MAVQYDVFLSYHSADRAAVEVIHARLRAARFRPFLDRGMLVPGEPFQPGLVEALDDSACVAIFVGPSGGGSWQREEMEYALNKAVRTRNDYRVIPVLLPGAEISKLEGFLGLRTAVDFRTGLDDEDAFRRLVAGIQGVAPDSAEGLLVLPDEPRPYRGIEYFDREQHAFYFGRDLQIQDLTARLETDRFVSVVGGSGSGKSSLVRAGLYTDAAERALPGIRDWHRVVFVPEKNPLLQLAAHLVAHLPESERPALIARFLDGFRTDGGLIAALAALFPGGSPPVLIVIDQFEEVFTQRPADEARQEEWRARTARFAANLRAAVDEGPSWLRVVIALRADFLDRFVRNDFPDFRELIERRQFWVAPMSEEDIREVVVRPATRCGAFFEKGLVERILAGMQNATKALPLLEEALGSLWDRRRGPWLTHQAYDDIGGVGGALAGKANRIFRSLSPAQQRIARRVFLKLVRPGEGSKDTRMRVRRSELSSVTDDPADLSHVLEVFARPGARLLSISSGVEGPFGSGHAETTVEVTHEALIDHWQLLRDWLDERRDDVRLDRRLAEAAQRWEEESRKPNGKPRGLLWRPPELDLARDLVAREQGAVSELQQQFIQHSGRAESARRLGLWASVIGLLCAILGFGSAYLISIAPPDGWEAVPQPIGTEEYVLTQILPVHDIAIHRKDPSVILYLGRNAAWDTARLSIAPHPAPANFAANVTAMLRSPRRVDPVARVTFAIESEEEELRGRGTMLVSAALDAAGRLRFVRSFEFMPAAGSAAKPLVIAPTVLEHPEDVLDLGEYAEALTSRKLLAPEDTIAGEIHDLVGGTREAVEFQPDDLLADGYESRQEYWGPEYKIFSNVDAEKLRIGSTTLAAKQNDLRFWTTIAKSPDWATYEAPVRRRVYAEYGPATAQAMVKEMKPRPEFAASLGKALEGLDWNHDAVEATMLSTPSPAGRTDALHLQWVQLPQGTGTNQPDGDDWILRTGGSDTWKRVKLPGSDVVGVWSLEKDGRSALLLTAGRGFYRTRDGGVSWEPANYNETGFTSGTKVKPIVVGDGESTFALIDRGTTVEDGENPLFRLKHRSTVERWRAGAISLLR